MHIMKTFRRKLAALYLDKYIAFDLTLLLVLYFILVYFSFAQRIDISEYVSFFPALLLIVIAFNSDKLKRLKASGQFSRIVIIYTIYFLLHFFIGKWLKSDAANEVNILVLLSALYIILWMRIIIFSWFVSIIYLRSNKKE